MKIIVSAFSNLTTDQRIEKVCDTLSGAGFQVHLIGSTWGDDHAVIRPYPTEKIKLKSRILKTAYLEFNIQLQRRIRQLVTDESILYCNDLDALMANHLVARNRAIPLIYDSHEIFTEMPSVNGRWTQKIWRWIERNTLSSVHYMITASDSYADWFEKKYGIQRPTVVRNFPKRNFIFSDAPHSPKIILYQGALNPSRGIDKMILALPQIEDAMLYIAGDGPIRKDLEELVAKQSLHGRVKFLGKLSPKELVQITPKADIGLSIEENDGLSYYYSLPNKVSDYIQAGVPILTSPFPEMKKINEQYQVGEIIENHSATELGGKINRMLALGKAHYREHLEHAARDLCWEHEEKNLLSVIHQARRDFFSPR